MMVTSEWIVASVVFVLVCLVFAHLAGREGGRREQEERYNALERPEWEAGMARVDRETEILQKMMTAERRRHSKALRQEQEAAHVLLEAQEAKYQRMLDEASDELADANARIDFFWEYACKVTVSADNGPQIRLRTERQDRDEFDKALTQILGATVSVVPKRNVVIEDPTTMHTPAEVDAIVQKKIAELESGDPDD